MKIKDNSYNRGYVSFSRYGRGITGQGSNFSRIVIDGTKLSNSVKIIPHSQASSNGKLAPYKKPENKQALLRIYKKEVDISKCILQVDILSDYALFLLSNTLKKFIASKTKLNIVNKFNNVKI